MTNNFDDGNAPWSWQKILNDMYRANPPSPPLNGSVMGTPLPPPPLNGSVMGRPPYIPPPLYNNVYQDAASQNQFVFKDPPIRLRRGMFEKKKEPDELMDLMDLYIQNGLGYDGGEALNNYVMKMRAQKAQTQSGKGLYGQRREEKILAVDPQPREGLDGRDGIVAPFPALKAGSIPVYSATAPESLKKNNRKYTFADVKDLDQTTAIYSPISFDNTEVTSHAGYRPVDKKKTYYKWHAGMDLGGNPDRSPGKPINAQASFSGKVVEVGTEKKGQPGFGNYVVIEHPDGTRIRYAHLANIAKPNGVDMLKPNDIIKAKDVLGVVGKSGTKAEHLHLEVFRVNDKGKNIYYDPGAYFANQGFRWKVDQ